MTDKSEQKKQMLFSDLNDAELSMIAQKMVVEKYTKGSSISQEKSFQQEVTNGA